MNLADLKTFLLYQFKSEADLVNAIEVLSHNFTKDRSKVSEYLSSERLVSAYTYFYLSTNMPKLDSVLTYINKSYEDFEEFEFVDIGTGPGTFLYSLLEHLPHNKFYGIETSDLMRAQAQKILSGMFPKADVDLVDKVKSVPKKATKRLGIFSHSANEMTKDQVALYISSLELDEVLFIEPGTKEYFKKSLEIRSHLIKEEFNIHYPCSSNELCPMGEQDWCHQFIKITHAPDVQRLCQLVKKDRSLLPLSIQYYSKTQRVNKGLKRVTRTFKPTKFSVEMELCHVHENKNEIIHFQQLTRNLKKKQVKKLSATYAGESVEYKVDKVLPDGIVRGDINES